jgi:tight adherence protein B
MLVFDAAVLCFPVGVGRYRLANLMAEPGSGPGPNRPVAVLLVRTGLFVPGDITHSPRFVGAAALLGSVLGALTGGIGTGLASAMATGLAAHRLGAARARSRRGRELSTLMDALGVMRAELRAGSHPATAASAAAAATDRARAGGAEFGGVHGILLLVAASARLGADVPAMLRRRAAGEPAIGAELTRLAAAWSLTERHGVGFAHLLDAVRADLESRIRLAGQVQAQLAGPRSTSAVLAGLPVLGILLGQGIGANPWHVLSSTLIGQVLLVIGVGLACLGIVWAERITGKAGTG